MDYPATIEIERPKQMARWRPLAQWLLAIPHLVIAGALWEVQCALAIVSWLMILLTGQLPSGIANFQVMITRYRTRAYLYAGFLYDRYPAFDFTMSADEPGGSPVAISITPELAERNRLTAGLRPIWMIPALLYAIVIGIVGLLCWIAGFVAVLATGRWPNWLWNWVAKSQRVMIRVSAYALLLTDAYPPFRTD